MITTFTVMFLLCITVISFTIIGIVYSNGRLGSVDDFFTARGSTGTRILSATFLASFLGVFILFTPPEESTLNDFAKKKIWFKNAYFNSLIITILYVCSFGS
ncbi:MAG TPA: hypothetical protein GXZ90_04970 [Clostridiales bacterium]|nr:hypothetical protein [Clostridiales bacterium]